jgi:hypothetical protein
MMNLRLVMMRGVDRLDLPGIEPHQISGVGAVSKRRGRQAIKGKPLKKLPQSLLAALLRQPLVRTNQLPAEIGHAGIAPVPIRWLI